MTYKYLIKNHILKIFLLNLFTLFLSLSLYSESVTEIYRSNYNGLKLVKIDRNQAKEYKFVLFSLITDKLEQRRVLYEGNKEVKRWLYYYLGNRLNQEKYYKENIIQAEYRYDDKGHKIKQEEYKDNNKIRITSYTYNSDGLVDTENIYNILSKQYISVKYRYDRFFQIKQIEKRYSDGSFIFWECFFSGKGIIQKEFYTLKNETYTFWYNENGQETRGEVTSLNELNQEDIKKEWTNQYNDKGKKTKKIENDYLIGRKIITLYNNNYQETRIETFKNDKIISIELFEYNEHNKVSVYEIIEDLTSSKTLYLYDDEKELIKTTHFTNDVLKKIVDYNKDGTRVETIHVKDKQVQVKYDKDGNIIE
ncbi:MAG: hypothetical protein JXB50_14820 [Spirochaetes bacterium]|nr:hypothetical protein [Spirochaetota bacterium]